jgi:hypothetical protein
MAVTYRSTERNHAIVTMLDELGFEYRPQGGNDGTFVRQLDLPMAEDDVVEVVDLSAERSRRHEHSMRHEHLKLKEWSRWNDS